MIGDKNTQISDHLPLCYGWEGLVFLVNAIDMDQIWVILMDTNRLTSQSMTASAR